MAFEHDAHQLERFCREGGKKRAGRSPRATARISSRRSVKLVRFIARLPVLDILSHEFERHAILPARLLDMVKEVADQLVSASELVGHQLRRAPKPMPVHLALCRFLSICAIVGLVLAPLTAPANAVGMGAAMMGNAGPSATRDVGAEAPGAEMAEGMPCVRRRSWAPAIGRSGNPAPSRPSSSAREWNSRVGCRSHP